MSPSSPGLRVLAPSAPVSVMTRMLLSPTQPDVVISAADGVTVATHAAVLAAASHKLRPLFTGAERGVFSLHVPRIPSSIWHHLLSLLHTGAASVPDEATLISLIETAALLRMDELSDALKLTHARCQQETQGEGGLLDTKGGQDGNVQHSPSKTQHTSTCEGKVTEEYSRTSREDSGAARNTGKDSSASGGSSWNMQMPYAYSHKQEVLRKTSENQVSFGNENYNRISQDHTASIATASNVGGHNLWNAQTHCADQYKQAMGDKMSPGFYNGNSIDIGTIARDLDRASSNLDSIMAEVSMYSNVSKRQLWHLPPGATSDPWPHHPDMVQGSQQLASSEYANKLEPMSFRQLLNQTGQEGDIKAETDEISGGKDGQSVDIDGGRGNGNITDVRSVDRFSWDGEKEEATGYHGYIKQEKDAFKHKVAKNLVKKGIAVLHKQKQDIKSKIAAGKAKDTALTSDGLTSREGAGDKSRRWIMDITDTCCHLCGHASVDQREAALHLMVDHGHKRCHRCKSCGSSYVSRRGLREHVNRSAVCGRHITYVGAVIPNPGKNPSTINKNVVQLSSIEPNVTKPTVQKQPRKIKKRRRSGIRKSLENIINQQAKPTRIGIKPVSKNQRRQRSENLKCMDTMCIKCGVKSSCVKEAAEHLRTKHRVKFPFVCRVCAKCYSSQPALSHHFKRVCWTQTDTKTHQGESVKNATECVDSNIYNSSMSSGDINTTAANNCQDGNVAEFNGSGVSAGFRSVNNRVFQGESVQTMTKCSDNNTTVSSEDRNSLLHDFLQGENDKNQTERNINNDNSVSLEYGVYLLQMAASNNEHRPHQSQSNKNTKEYNNNNSTKTVSPRNRHQRIQKSTQAIIQERMIPSKCHICSYTNENLTEVLYHYAVVHGRDNCFNCKNCGKIFRRSQDLYAHYSSKHRAVEKLTARNRVQHSTPNKVHQNGTAGIVNTVDQDSTQDTANKVHHYSTESTATKVHQDSTQTTANKVHLNNSQGTANEGRTRFSMKDMIDGVIDYSMVQAATKETCPNNVHTNTNEEYQENAQSTLDKESPDPLQFSSPTYEGTEESMDYSLLPYEYHDNHFEADFSADEDPADAHSDLHIVSISRVSGSPQKAAPITHLGSDVQ